MSDVNPPGQPDPSQFPPPAPASPPPAQPPYQPPPNQTPPTAAPQSPAQWAAPTGPATPPPAAPKSRFGMKGCLIVIGVILAAIAVFVVIAGFFARSLLESNLIDWLIVETPESAEVGDCYIFGDPEAVQVDCSAEHHFEVVSIQDEPLTTSDGQPSVPLIGDDACDDVADAYTGGSDEYQSRQLFGAPDASGEFGGPTLCVVHVPDSELFQGSARG